MKYSALLFFLLFLGLFSFVPQVQATQSWVIVDSGANVIGATVDTSARKTFFAADLWWVFWADGTNMVYSTSADGISWSSKTTIRALSNGDRFSWTADDFGYHHYAAALRTSGTDVFYRRGVFENDGSITWSAAEQTVTDIPVGSSAYMPDIAVDTDRAR